MSEEKDQKYVKKNSKIYDEKTNKISVEGKADEAPRFDISSIEDDKKAKFFKVLFFAVFFNVLNLLCIGNLHQELILLQTETDTSILDEYPGFFKSVQALFAMNLVQLILVGLLTYATIKLNLSPFRVFFFLTICVVVGKFICSVNFLSSEKEVQKEFKQKILEINESEIDSCLDDDAFKCRTIFTWNFCYYETIIDLIFGTVFSAVMIHTQKKQKQEIIAEAVRVAPSTGKEHDYEKNQIERKNTQEIKEQTQNQKAQEEDVDKLSIGGNNQNQEINNNKNKSLQSENMESEEPMAQENKIQKKQARRKFQTNLLNQIQNENEIQNAEQELSLDNQADKLNDSKIQLRNSPNEEIKESFENSNNENIFQLNDSINDSKIIMRNSEENSNISPEKILESNQELAKNTENISPVKATNIRGRKQIKKIKIVNENILEKIKNDQDQEEEQ